MTEYFVLYLILGATAGFFAGLFGIGGGLILVPFLAWIYAAQAFPVERIMLMAIATSLATIIPTALSSVRAHHAQGAVDWSIVVRLAPGILVGSLIGTLVAQQLDTHTLKTIFGVFLIAVSIQTAFGFKPEKPSWVFGKLLGSVAGALIGAFSSLVGIGGGTLTVPFLLKCRQPIRNAVAISAACGLPIAVAGSIGYAALGWNISNQPEWSFGYIYGPAFIGIAASSVLFAPLGAKLAHNMPTGRLKQSFALFIFVVGCKLLL